MISSFSVTGVCFLLARCVRLYNHQSRDTAFFFLVRLAIGPSGTAFAFAFAFGSGFGVGTALGMAHLNIVPLAILVLFGSTPLSWSCVKILALTGFASAHPSSFRMRRLTLVSSSRPSFSNASCQHTSQKSFLVTSRSADSQALRDTSPELLLTHRSSHILRSLRFSLLNACVSAGWRSHVSFAGTYTSRIPRRVAR